MATNLAIDDRLIEEARIIGKHATKKGVVTEALQEYIQRRKQTEILDMFHTVDYALDYDYKEQRKISIFTTDTDFTFFRQYLPIRLHRPRSD